MRYITIIVRWTWKRKLTALKFFQAVPVRPSGKRNKILHM